MIIEISITTTTNQRALTCTVVTLIFYLLFQCREGRSPEKTNINQGLFPQSQQFPQAASLAFYFATQKEKELKLQRLNLNLFVPVSSFECSLFKVPPLKGVIQSWCLGFLTEGNRSTFKAPASVTAAAGRGGGGGGGAGGGSLYDFKVSQTFLVMADELLDLSEGPRANRAVEQVLGAVLTLVDF